MLLINDFGMMAWAAMTEKKLILVERNINQKSLIIDNILSNNKILNNIAQFQNFNEISTYFLTVFCHWGIVIWSF